MMTDEADLTIEAGNVEIGGVYPLYGMITKVISETSDNVLVEINHNVELRMLLVDASSLETIKRRAFDPGIFVSKITSIDGDRINADCSVVIFGKQPGSSLEN